MTYSAYDTSTQDGSPLEIYRFVIGGKIYLYANGEEEVEYDSAVYLPQPILRSQVENVQEFNKSSLTINLPRDASIAIEFNSGVPDEVVMLTVFRRQYLDSSNEWLAYWSGRVVAPRFEGHELILKCEPLFTALRRPGLRMVYQITCPHALYDSKCGASKYAFYVHGAVTGILDDTIQCAELAGYPAGYFSGGFVIINGSRRMITDHAGNTATLLYPYPGLAVGTLGDFYAGCDRLLSTCDVKFGNKLNFGGYPWIPEKNPFTGDAII